MLKYTKTSSSSTSISFIIQAGVYSTVTITAQEMKIKMYKWRITTPIITAMEKTKAKMQMKKTVR